MTITITIIISIIIITLPKAMANIPEEFLNGDAVLTETGEKMYMAPRQTVSLNIISHHLFVLKRLFIISSLFLNFGFLDMNFRRSHRDGREDVCGPRQTSCVRNLLDWLRLGWLKLA